MIKAISLSLVAALSLFACGDNTKLHNDAPPSNGSDSGSGGIPAAPTLGTQIDRMGRPAVNTALNHGFDGSAGVPSGSANASKDAYNADSSVGTWPQTWSLVFMRTLPILDALDTGVCGNGICEPLAGETPLTCPGGSNSPGDCTATGTNVGSDGCGNQAFFMSNLGSAAYFPLASVLADDELYVETAKSTCAGYLAVEFYTDVIGSPPQSCGGRAPTYDVIDTTYTVVALGTHGFNAMLQPAFGDTVGAHTDVSDTVFPFLGAPH